ncbi:MAG: pyrroline-5-carboxylate reductase [Desulfobacterales bacterium]
MSSTFKIGFIGAGNMGEAMIGALIQSKSIDAGEIVAADIRADRLDELHRKYGIAVHPGTFALFDECGIVILAVKPQTLPRVLTEIVSAEDYGVRRRKLVISIAAGIHLRRIESLLYSGLDDKQKKNLPIIRVMPNTPALVLCAMSAMSSNAYCREEDRRAARKILESMGSVIEVEEGFLDAVTAISGSGPAYVFYIIEAMVSAGEELGLAPSVAGTLAVQTFKGAVKLLEETGESAEKLRRNVTSPGGTTEAALHAFEQKNVKKHIKQAVHAAAKRAKELSSI